MVCSEPTIFEYLLATAFFIVVFAWCVIVHLGNRAKSTAETEFDEIVKLLRER